MSTTTTTRRTVSCGFCQETGHNRRTCPHNNNVTIRKKNKTWKRRIQYESKDYDCSICFEDCKKKGCELECGHRFHTKCLFTWLSKNDTCPNCRAKVPELKKTNEKLRLPSTEIVAPILYLLNQTISTETLNKEEYTAAFYMLLKSKLERLSGDAYNELLDTMN